jgi:hypothetical protein
MPHIENRAAENGSKIISDANAHTFSKSRPIIAIRVLEDTVITALVATNMGGTEDYYDLAELTSDDPIILGNFTSITLTSGAVQAIY